MPTLRAAVAFTLSLCTAGVARAEPTAPGAGAAEAAETASVPPAASAPASSAAKDEAPTSSTSPEARSAATDEASAGRAPSVLSAPAAPSPSLPTATPEAALARRVVGLATAYHPLASFDVLGDAHLEVPVSLLSAFEDTSAFALDRDGTKSSAALVVSPRLRVGARFTQPRSWQRWTLLAEYEQDLPTGSLTGVLPEGLGMPGSEPFEFPVRKAMLRVGYGNAVTVAAGVTTSHWGLGLLANDGAHGWEPGSGRFTDPRGGDRVRRVIVATGPHYDSGLVAAIAYDLLLDDDSLLLRSEQLARTQLGDDAASQVVGSLSVGRPGETWAGVYVAHRSQTSSDGRRLEVTAFDASGTFKRRVEGLGLVTAGLEAAYLDGWTTLSGTGSFPTQTVRQLGVLTRNGLDRGTWGVGLDGAFASGDRNGDDAQQNGFRADPNADLGLLLYRQVLAAQSARAVTVAGNPQLVGLPAPGLERLPTRGAFTNTVAVFPRAFVRPLDGLEVYGGVLLAWSAVPLADPFNTRLAGGSLRNALDGRPGGLLGVEADVGVKGRFLVSGTELLAGLEGGVLLPGDALRDATGKNLGTVTGGRLVVGWRL